MENRLEIIVNILEKESKNISIDKIILTKQMRTIGLEFFSELCDVYLDKIEEGKYILELHFNDDNYYEIDIREADTIQTLSAKILEDFIYERFIDKELLEENRNNVRYFRKYN